MSEVICGTWDADENELDKNEYKITVGFDFSNEMSAIDDILLDHVDTYSAYLVIHDPDEDAFRLIHERHIEESK